MLSSLPTCSVVKGTQAKAGNANEIRIASSSCFLKKAFPQKPLHEFKRKQHSSVQATEDDNSNFHFCKRDVPVTKFHNQVGVFSA